MSTPGGSSRTRKYGNWESTRPPVIYPIMAVKPFPSTDYLLVPKVWVERTGRERYTTRQESAYRTIRDMVRKHRKAWESMATWTENDRRTFATRAASGEALEWWRSWLSSRLDRVRAANPHLPKFVVSAGAYADQVLMPQPTKPHPFIEVGLWTEDILARSVPPESSRRSKSSWVKRSQAGPSVTGLASRPPSEDSWSKKRKQAPETGEEHTNDDRSATIPESWRGRLKSNASVAPYVTAFPTYLETSTRKFFGVHVSARVGVEGARLTGNASESDLGAVKARLQEAEDSFNSTCPQNEGMGGKPTYPEIARSTHWRDAVQRRLGFAKISCVVPTEATEATEAIEAAEATNAIEPTEETDVCGSAETELNPRESQRRRFDSPNATLMMSGAPGSGSVLS